MVAMATALAMSNAFGGRFFITPRIRPQAPTMPQHTTATQNHVWWNDST